jgi:hypothetical protein|tara:strand:+ start:134 stop:349 length:216 start_codon:yes stop_codon:yes gene_type:complete
MPKIIIDGVEYHTEDLSDSGREQLKSLQFLDSQIQTIRNELAIYQTARIAYIKILKSEITKSGIAPVSDEV